ncbi:MAG: hypothetical protein RR202_10440 [Bacteroidales bacterium]
MAKYVGITVQGLDKILKTGDTKASTIERIAAYFSVSIDSLFTSDQQTGAGKSPSLSQIVSDNVYEYSTQIQHLKDLLAEKNKQLEEKERFIQLLLNK